MGTEAVVALAFVWEFIDGESDVWGVDAEEAGWFPGDLSGHTLVKGHQVCKVLLL